MWIVALFAAALAAPVTIEVNHAFVKDQPVEGAQVAASRGPDEAPTVLETSGANGRIVLDLEPGTWYLSTAAQGFVPLPAEAVEVPDGGRHLTTTLTPLLESMGEEKSGRRRVQIVLNWGSAWNHVPDVDAHLLCVDSHEIYFGSRDHKGAGHEVDLDVDDVDWGGPETITLWDPPPGRYRYFVRNFSGAMSHLGASEVQIRVLDGDRLVGTYPIPTDVRDEDWWPFEALEIDERGVRVVMFSPADLAAGRDRSSRAGFQWGLGGCTTPLCLVGGMVSMLVLLPLIGRLRRR